jgi:hypothetical protein
VSGVRVLEKLPDTRSGNEYPGNLETLFLSKKKIGGKKINLAKKFFNLAKPFSLFLSAFTQILYGN